MFDEIQGMAKYCSDNFCSSVRDEFGVSIVNDVLEPIQNEIGLLCAFHEEFQRNTLNFQQVIQEAQSLQMRGDA